MTKQCVERLQVTLKSLKIGDSRRTEATTTTAPLPQPLPQLLLVPIPWPPVPGPDLLRHRLLPRPAMPLYSVTVKWGKEKFEGVELNTAEPPVVFKAQLFALTGVQPARQKVMVKGGTLKDDD
ncbi:hypothetical protein P7K49_007349 [Saguinus oedipus]|uniref:Ubiquitin carboxyl-terminal hydrolase 14 n=1 Tax=Saguinus oedipus TaxID=9490 RepID=A0ABQ9VUL0_SAGOE|nr:hypothetical protein P7K49_007349 [Saguinus oedipus]